MSKLNKSLFNKAIRNGRIYQSANISLKTHKSLDIDDSMFYFVISKKSVKSAVKRNLFKRRGRYIIRLEAKNINPVRSKKPSVSAESMIRTSYGIKKHHMGIFFLKKGVNNISYQQFREEIHNLLKKANLLLNN